MATPEGPRRVARAIAGLDGQRGVTTGRAGPTGRLTRSPAAIPRHAARIRVPNPPPVEGSRCWAGDADGMPGRADKQIVPSRGRAIGHVAVLAPDRGVRLPALLASENRGSAWRGERGTCVARGTRDVRGNVRLTQACGTPEGVRGAALPRCHAALRRLHPRPRVTTAGAVGEELGPSARARCEGRVRGRAGFEGRVRGLGASIGRMLSLRERTGLGNATRIRASGPWHTRVRDPRPERGWERTQ
jgi:hypothetical protein